ncbi:IS66 family transposase zinc-finger binding domain-containing protein [Reyranella sp.]|uniref:IS66 family transposase zinc-finger binding domain-containing protein n=1 Tax=Reyranella sp. TaxID=1929291 RepID=UPI0027316BA9|nr:IS66 family transposase zinc-finger binding domain-containing protein [Reyranella sp.]MDP2374373.1 IS66 family transposase zinc-finger binding domain-containing protein [Reyranella sp.]
MPAACPCCGGALHKLGEDVTETRERVPRPGKVIQHVRETHSCRSCEKITQPPAPRTRLPADASDRGCWPMSCSPSTACTVSDVVGPRCCDVMN